MTAVVISRTPLLGPHVRIRQRRTCAARAACWSSRANLLNSSPAQRHHLAAVDHDRGAGDEAAGVRHQEQQHAVEIALLAEAADRDLTLDLRSLLAQQVIAVHL